MCMTCGCRDFDNDHGDEKNITYRRLVDAAEAGGVTLEEAVEHLRQGVAAIRRRERARVLSADTRNAVEFPASRP
jgi:hypothetical protein